MWASALWPKEVPGGIRLWVLWKSSLADRFPSATRTRPKQDFRDAERPHVALYVGGMGPVGQNFYNDLFVKLRVHHKQARRIQELYLSGKREEAEALVPSDYLKSTLLVGDEDHVRGRIEAFRAAGVTCLNIEIPDSVRDPVSLVEMLREWTRA